MTSLLQNNNFKKQTNSTKNTEQNCQNRKYFHFQINQKIHQCIKVTSDAHERKFQFNKTNKTYSHKTPYVSGEHAPNRPCNLKEQLHEKKTVKIAKLFRKKAGKAASVGPRPSWPGRIPRGTGAPAYRRALTTLARRGKFVGPLSRPRDAISEASRVRCVTFPIGKAGE